MNIITVQVNRSRRLPNIFPTRTICGMEYEIAFHATMCYTKTLALKQGLTDGWRLSPENKLTFMGHGWVLVLLDSLNQDLNRKIDVHLVEVLGSSK